MFHHPRDFSGVCICIEAPPFSHSYQEHWRMPEMISKVSYGRTVFSFMPNIMPPSTMDKDTLHHQLGKLPKTVLKSNWKTVKSHFDLQNK